MLQHLHLPIRKNDYPPCVKLETQNDKKQRLAALLLSPDYGVSVKSWNF